MKQTQSNSSGYFNHISLFCSKKPLVIIFLMLIVGALSIFVYLKHLNSLAIRSASIESSQRYAQVINQFRSVYTTEVVNKITDSGITVSHNYATINNAIPLPASFGLLVSERMKLKGLNVQAKLYSEFPFSSKSSLSEINSTFEKAAWKSLNDNPNEAYVSIEKVDGILSVRYASANVMRAECIDCHNNHPESSKRDWQVGDVRGVLEIIEPIDAALKASNSIFIQMVVLFSALLLLGFFAFVFAFDCLTKKNAVLALSINTLNKSIAQQQQSKTILQEEKALALIDKQIALVAKDRAFSADKAKSIFLANISHELRTPMNAIVGHTNVIQTNQKTPFHNIQSLNLIEHSSNHLLSVIDDILELTKLDVGTTKLTVCNFDLIQTCQQAVDMLQLSAQEKQLTLCFNNKIDSDRLMVNGDGPKLKQVLLNLLSNGVKFTEKGEVSLTLEALEDSVFTIDVKDTGIGISEQKLDTVFDAFCKLKEKSKLHLINEKLSQSRYTKTFNYDGAGLGLSIAKKNLKLMHSDISLHSTLGKGSSFSFDICLPMHNTVLSNTPVNEEPRDNHFLTHTLLSFNKSNPKHILMMGNCPVNIPFLQDALTQTGFIIHKSSAALNPIDILKNNNIHLVVVDNSIPDLDSARVIKQIKDEQPTLNIITVSAAFLSSDSQKTIDTSLGKTLTDSAKLINLYEIVARSFDLDTDAAAKPLDVSIADQTSFKLSPDYANLIIEQCDMYLVREVELMIEKLSLQFPNNEHYFSQLQHFVANYDLEGLTSFLKGDING